MLYILNEDRRRIRVLLIHLYKKVRDSRSHSANRLKCSMKNKSVDIKKVTLLQE